MNVSNLNIVQSRALRLLQPGQVNEVWLNHEMPEHHIVVEPTIGSICHADLRYFTGQRRPEALARKLPMALIHEGIGRVVESRTERFHAGERVIIVPNWPGHALEGIRPEECCASCRSGKGDNYCERGRFLGSGTDGIAQSRIVVPADCLIKVPDDVPDEVAVLAELCSVSYQALGREASNLKNAKVAVFGDGPVGYLTAAVLHHVFGVSRDKLLVFGAIPEKLDHFKFAQTALVQHYEFGKGPAFDIAVECTGGKFSESAINQCIDILSPGGKLILMGVTEDRVPINTRDVLEKGITMTGSSRSSSADYIPVVKAMRSKEFQETLSRLLPDHYHEIKGAEDFTKALEETAAHRGWKKTVLSFDWHSSHV